MCQRKWIQRTVSMVAATVTLVACGGDNKPTQPLPDTIAKVAFMNASGLPYSGGPEISENSTGTNGEYMEEISTSGVCPVDSNSCNPSPRFPYLTKFTLCNGNMVFPQFLDQERPPYITLDSGETLPPGYTTTMITRRLTTDYEGAIEPPALANIAIAVNAYRVMMMVNTNGNTAAGIAVSLNVVAAPCQQINFSGTLETDPQVEILQAYAPTQLPTYAAGAAALTEVVVCRDAGFWAGSHNAQVDSETQDTVGGPVGAVIDSVGNSTVAMSWNRGDGAGLSSAVYDQSVNFNGVDDLTSRFSYTVPFGPLANAFISLALNAPSTVPGTAGAISWNLNGLTGAGTLARVSGRGYFDTVSRIVIGNIQGGTKTWVAVVDTDHGNNVGGIVADYPNGKEVLQLTGSKVGQVVTFNDTKNSGVSGRLTIDPTSMTSYGNYNATGSISVLSDGVNGVSVSAPGCNVGGA